MRKHLLEISCALIGLLAAAAAGWTSACGRGGVRQGPATLVRLPLSDADTMAVSGDTREGLWLGGGDAITWTIPPTPGGRIETSFLLPDGDGSEALEVRRRLPDGGAEVSSRVSIRADRTAWQPVVFEWAEQKNASELELRFVATSGSAWAFLASPVLRITGRATNRTVVLVIVDTLRADHLSGYGYGPRTSPNIDRFFEGGLKVDSCFSTEPWTLPSIASILTSSPAAVHRTGLDRSDLPREFPVLAESFRGAGYRTLAVTGGGFVDPDRGFARGFDRFVTTGEMASGAVEKALRAVAEYPGDPLFLLFHTYQVHDYRTEPSAVQDLFGGMAGLDGAWDAPITGLLEGKSSQEIWGLKSFLTNRYDAAIRSTDAAFGRLVSGLGKQDRLADSVVLLTSDHGEDLLDRGDVDGTGNWGHTSPTLYDTGLHVPFLLRDSRVPKPPAVPSDEDRTLLDVAPTLLSACGLPSPDSFEGRPVPVSRGLSRPVAALAPGYDAIAIRAGGRKLIARADYPLCSWIDGSVIWPGIPEECFDVRDDPGERHARSCGDPAFQPLWAEWDRQVARLFPGSLLIRNPSDPHPPTRVTLTAKGGSEAPLVTGFRLPLARRDKGEDEEVEWVTRRVTTWVAISPQDESRALSLHLSGLSELRAARGLVIRDGAGPEWASLLEEPGLRTGAAWWLVSSVPAAIRAARTRYVASEEAVRRLMSLGYAAAGPEPQPASRRRGSAEPENTDRSLGRGEIRVRIVAPE